METTGSQAQVSFWDMVWEASVTRPAVHMGVKEMGIQTGNRGTIQSASELDQETGKCVGTVEQLEEH